MKREPRELRIKLNPTLAEAARKLAFILNALPVEDPDLVTSNQAQILERLKTNILTSDEFHELELLAQEFAWPGHYRPRTEKHWSVVHQVWLELMQGRPEKEVFPEVGDLHEMDESQVRKIWRKWEKNLEDS